jgi:LytS/YehU family sensor histidine kinase
MLLLPLAENAVKYGPAAGHSGAIALEVKVRPEDDTLLISLRSPGPYRGRRAGGTGLEMVEKRLALAYDGHAMLRIAAVGETTVVEVVLPLAIAPAESPT